MITVKKITFKGLTKHVESKTFNQVGDVHLHCATRFALDNDVAIFETTQRHDGQVEYTLRDERRRVIEKYLCPGQGIAGQG